MKTKQYSERIKPMCEVEIPSNYLSKMCIRDRPLTPAAVGGIIIHVADAAAPLKSLIQILLKNKYLQSSLQCEMCIRDSNKKGTEKERLRGKIRKERLHVSPNGI